MENKNIELYKGYFLRFKVFFEKAAMVSANKYEISFSKDFINFMEMFYESLFLNDSLFWQKAVDKFAKEHSKAKTEKFLSTLFYLFINNIIKFFYTKEFPWQVMQKCYESMNAVMEYLFSSSVKKEQNEQKTTKPKEASLSSSELFEKLKQSIKKDEKIKLYNTYKGIPIEKECEVVDISKDAIYLKPHPIQEAAAIKQNMIFIKKNSSFPHDIQASFQVVPLRGENVFKISKFQISPKNLVNRKYIRITPTEALYAKIHMEPKDQVLKVKDLSLGGISLIKKSQILFSLPHEVDISLPIVGFPTLKFSAKLVKVTKSSEGFIYHFKINQTKHTENILSEYISKNQLKIIKELKENFSLIGKK